MIKPLPQNISFKAYPTTGSLKNWHHAWLLGPVGTGHYHALVQETSPGIFEIMGTQNRTRKYSGLGAAFYRLIGGYAATRGGKLILGRRSTEASKKVIAQLQAAGATKPSGTLFEVVP